MATKNTPKNRIFELRTARNLSQGALGKLIGTSAQQVEKLEKGMRKLTVEWILKLCAALDVSAHELVDLPIKNINLSRCDQTLLDSVIGYILEACDKMKIKPARQELSKWTSYVYNEVVDKNLNLQRTRELASDIVKVSQKYAK